RVALSGTHQTLFKFYMCQRLRAGGKTSSHPDTRRSKGQGCCQTSPVSKSASRDDRERRNCINNGGDKRDAPGNAAHVAPGLKTLADDDVRTGVGCPPRFSRASDNHDRFGARFVRTRDISKCVPPEKRDYLDAGL